MVNPDSINLRTLNIDSRLRKRGKAEDMEYELQEPVEMPRGACFWVTNVTLPVVWPNVGNSNQIYIKEYTTQQETLKVVNITPGNYNLTNLATALQDSLNATELFFEKDVSYGTTTVDNQDITIGLQWKGRDTRLDYTGKYESNLERSIDLSGVWTV